MWEGRTKEDIGNGVDELGNVGRDVVVLFTEAAHMRRVSCADREEKRGGGLHLTVEVTGPQAENWSSGAGYGQRMVVAGVS